MGKNYPLNLVGRFLLLAQLLVIASIVTVGEAFLPNGNVVCVSSRSFFPRSSQALFCGREASSSQDDGVSMKGTNKRRRENKRHSHKQKGHSSNNGNKAQSKKSSRPASFAAIRKELKKGHGNDEANVDSATIARIGKQTRRNRQKEMQEKRKQNEERRELKLRAYQLSIDSERGFRSTPSQEEEMNQIIDRLVQLNPTQEPAWSYYGKTNPLTRQLYQSLANQKGRSEEETLASLEGKWILTYTNVPSIVSLASDVPFAKLGRIGQECTPFPDYTVRTIIEWKRPDWVNNLKALGGISKWLFGKEESSVLQITTLRAKATPDDPTSWGISKVPRVFEIVSSKSSTALYDDEEDTSKGTLSFVTDDGLVAMDPLRPLKIGLQMAGRDSNKVLSDEEHGKHHHDEHGTTNLVTKNGLVALNPFQPWTVGLQMAGLGVKKANEPWKIAEVGKKNENHHNHHHPNNLLDDIHERGLVEGVLKQTPIQLPTPDAVASLLGDDEKATADNSQSDRILYLDEDIRIIGNGQNHVTIESRACTEEDEDCWF